LLYVSNSGIENFYWVLVGRYEGMNMEFRKLSKNSIGKIKGMLKTFHVAIKLSKSSFYVINNKNWPFGTLKSAFIK
jgi:hypothetical protein